MTAFRRLLFVSILLGLGPGLQGISAAAETVRGEAIFAKWSLTDEDVFGEDASQSRSIQIVQQPAEIPISAQRLARALSVSMQAPQIIGPITTPFDPTRSIPSVVHGYVIETSWMPMKGRTVGLLVWKRELETQLRLIITIQPAQLKPDKPTQITVYAMARERHNKNYEWVMSNVETAVAALEFSKPAVLRGVQIARIAERN